jgi:hypothetical protein
LAVVALQTPAALSASRAKGNADRPKRNGPIRMNTFDAVVYACLAVAVVLGFSSGLLRSLATILGYLAAAPVAFAAAPYLAPLVAEQTQSSP